MKIRLYLSIAFFIMSALTYGQEKYFIKTDGTKVQLHPTKFDIHPSGVMMTNENLEYFDINGKGQIIHQSDVQELRIGSELYTLLPITKKYNRLLRVVATNSKFIASTYKSDETEYLFIHDKESKEIANDKVAYFNVNTDYSPILPTLNKFFANCPTLFKMMEANAQTQEKIKKKFQRLGPFDNINNLTCE
jgi:hypothetical protein